MDKDSIRALTALCRIDCTEEEQASLLKDLQKMLAYFELLNEINTENVPPCNQVIAGVTNAMREDEVGCTLPREVFLENAPAQIGGMIRVPPILKTPS